MRSTVRWTDRRLVAVLVAVLAVAAALALAWPQAQPEGAEAWIEAAEAHRMQREGDLVIVDVRSPAEWQDTGIAQGARTVTIHNRSGMEGFLDALLAEAGVDRDTPLALICARGGRSARARAYLAEHGFTQVYDITAGMEGRPGRSGWIEQGLPSEPCSEC